MNTKKELDVNLILKNYSVLLTGASGFVGMAILKKLVEIIINNNMVNKRKVYVILRQSRNYPNINKRLEMEILTNELWSEYKNNMSILYSIIHPIEGDLIYDNLGVSEKDINLINYECKSNNDNEGIFVIHCAAAVQFNLDFNEAMNLNVAGTYYCLKLSKLINTKGFIHISTLYCNSREEGTATIYEEIYDQGFDSNEIFETWLHKKEKKYSNKEIKQILSYKRSKTTKQDEVKYSWPNTYTITKNIGESVVIKYCKENNINLSIARLGIISPQQYGKHAGWFMGNGGFVFVAIGAATGHLKYLNSDGLGRFDLVPVDYTINALMAISAKLLEKDDNDKPLIYQIGVVEHEPDDWNVACMFEYITPRWFASNIPGTLPGAGVKFIPNGTLFYLISLFLYDIPLLLLSPIKYLLNCYLNYFYNNNNKNLTPDQTLQLKMKLKHSKINKIVKEISFMQKARAKTVVFEENYTFFLNKRWRFNSKNVNDLYTTLNSECKKEFNFNIKEMNMNEYTLNSGMTVMRKWYETKRLYNEQMELQYQLLLKKNQKVNDDNNNNNSNNNNNNNNNSNNNNNNNNNNYRKIIIRISQMQDIIKKMGLSVLGVSITHYGISLLVTLFLLWVVFVFA